jgi:hypothetical protein
MDMFALLFGAVSLLYASLRDHHSGRGEQQFEEATRPPH